MRLITKATLLGLTLFSASVFASGQKTLKVGIEDSIAPFEFRENRSQGSFERQCRHEPHAADREHGIRHSEKNS